LRQTSLPSSVRYEAAQRASQDLAMGQRRPAWHRTNVPVRTYHYTNRVERYHGPMERSASISRLSALPVRMAS
jgi:hypothetical protein